MQKLTTMQIVIAWGSQRGSLDLDTDRRVTDLTFAPLNMLGSLPLLCGPPQLCCGALCPENALTGMSEYL